MRAEQHDWKFPITLGCCTLLMVGIMWYPSHAQRQTLRKHIETYEVALGLSGGGADLRQLAQQVDRLEEQVQQQTGYVPDSAQAGEVYQGIAAAFRGFEVRDREISTRNAAEYAEYGVMPVSVEFQAGFDEAFGVIRELESARRMMRLDRVEIESGRRDAESQSLSVQIELSAFFSLPPEPDPEVTP